MLDAFAWYRSTFVQEGNFMKKQVSIKNSSILFLTAAIWGVAFVAQSEGMDYVGAFTFNALRCLLGAVVLIPVIMIMGRKKTQMKLSAEEKKTSEKKLITGGICCGVLFFLASNFQQFGIKYTTVGKAGFITACYIVIVPILGLFMKKKCSSCIWGL